MKLSEKDIERFWNKVNIKEPNECWLWKGCIGKDGYGQLWVQGRTMHAIRISLHLSVGLPLFVVEKGQGYALHKIDCPNRICVNPNHLYVGTASDNRNDIEKTGTANYRKSRFSKDEMTEMRILKEKGVSQELIGLQYGITQQMVSYILRGSISSYN